MAETFLFIHGWATDNWVWEGHLKPIANGKRTINMNLPGHGGKEKWTEPDLKPAVKEVSNHISGINDRSVIGIGWSLGAQALIASATQFPDAFKALVLVGATPCFTQRHDFPHGQSKALVKRMLLDMKSDPETTLKRFYGLSFTDEELKTPGAKQLVDRYKFPGPIVCSTDVPGCFPAFKYNEITTALGALYNDDLRELLSFINIPALIIHGEKDTVCPVEAGRYLASHIKGADLMVFENAGHAPFITEKDLFIKVVQDFIEKL
ncbi:MAG: alpha/beta fold hydrolase [Deltaproteobacteria bacterium]|nr:alpha/beta fold hydrolase [Deltaproteobacteria bacterium]